MHVNQYTIWFARLPHVQALLNHIYSYPTMCKHLLSMSVTFTQYLMSPAAARHPFSVGRSDRWGSAQDVHQSQYASAASGVLGFGPALAAATPGERWHY